MKWLFTELSPLLCVIISLCISYRGSTPRLGVWWVPWVSALSHSVDFILIDFSNLSLILFCFWFLFYFTLKNHLFINHTYELTYFEAVVVMTFWISNYCEAYVSQYFWYYISNTLYLCLICTYWSDNNMIYFPYFLHILTS